MNNKTTVAIVFAALGALSGYWFRGQVQIAREQAEIRAFLSNPPHVLAAGPPTGVPLTLMDVAKPAPGKKR